MNGKLKRLTAMLAGLAVMIGASGTAFAETVPVSTATDAIVASPEVHEESDMQEQTEVSTESETPAPTPAQAATEAPVQAVTAAPSAAPEATPAQTATSEPTQIPVEEPTQAPTAEPTQAPAETPAPTPENTPENTPAQEPSVEPAPVASPEATAEPALTASPEATAEPMPEATAEAAEPAYVWIDAGAAVFSQAGMGEAQRLGTLPDGAYAYLLEEAASAARVALAVQTDEGQDVLTGYVSASALRPATAEEAQGTIAYADAWLKLARLETPEAPEDENRPESDFAVRVEIVNAAQSYRSGDQVTLRAVIEGEAPNPAYQWQYDAGDGWRDADGSAETFTFSIDETNYTWKWRAVVYAGAASEADAQTSGT